MISSIEEDFKGKVDMILNEILQEMNSLENLKHIKKGRLENVEDEIVEEMSIDEVFSQIKDLSKDLEFTEKEENGIKQLIFKDSRVIKVW